MKKNRKTEKKPVQKEHGKKMANQTFPNNFDQVSWDNFDYMDATLTQEEFDSLIGDTSGFTPLDGYNTRSMETTEVSPDPLTTIEYASLLVDQFLTVEQLALLPVPVSRAPHLAMEELNTQPMYTTSYSHQPEMVQQVQTLPAGDDFSLLLNDSCFGTSEFTDPMAEDLDQIFIESSGQTNISENSAQQAAFADAAIDPNWFELVMDPAYTYGSEPSAAAGSLPDQSLIHQAQDAQFDLDNFDYLFNAPAVHQPAPLYPLEEYQNFQFNDDDGMVGDQTVAPPAKQLFLPPSTERRARKERKKSTARVAVKSEAGPSTPTQAVRKPLVAISPLKCAGQIKVVNQIKKTNGQVVELPYKYSVYKPLRPWGKITYNDRGYLHENIRFNARRMKDFVSSTFTLPICLIYSNIIPF